MGRFGEVDFIRKQYIRKQLAVLMAGVCLLFRFLHPGTHTVHLLDIAFAISEIVSTTCCAVFSCRGATASVK